MTALSRIGTRANGEEGHVAPGVGALIGGAGAILLGIGAANDTGWLAILGGIVLAAGMLATLLINHLLVEYAIYDRLNALEGSSAGEGTVTTEQT